MGAILLTGRPFSLHGCARQDLGGVPARAFRAPLPCSDQALFDEIFMHDASSHAGYSLRVLPRAPNYRCRNQWLQKKCTLARYYTMRADALDRLGAQPEQQFSADQFK